MFRQFQPEFAQNAARVEDGARAIGRRLVPDRRQAEHRPRVAGAERAHDQVVDLRRVLDHHHVFSLPAGKTKLGDGGAGVLEQALLEGGIHPRASDDSGAVVWPDLSLVSINQRVERGRVDQPLVHEQRLESLDAELRLGQRSAVRSRAVVVMVVIAAPHDLLLGRIHCRGQSPTVGPPAIRQRI